jgi:hypothetical protein
MKSNIYYKFHTFSIPDYYEPFIYVRKLLQAKKVITLYWEYFTSILKMWSVYLWRHARSVVWGSEVGLCELRIFIYDVDWRTLLFRVLNAYTYASIAKVALLF